MTDDTDQQPDADEAGSTSELTRPVDRVTPNSFFQILEAYAEDDRIESGVCRLELDDGTERRLVVDEDLPGLDDDAYARRELAELVGLLADDDLTDRNTEFVVPVGDVDRVVAEAKELGSITVFFETAGIQSLLQRLLANLETGEDEPVEAPPVAAYGHGGRGGSNDGDGDDGDEDDETE